MAKIHLSITPHAISSGSDQIAFCGELIPKAEQLPPMSLCGRDPSSTLFCKVCFGPHYRYYIVSGQEGLDAKRKREEEMEVA